VRPENQTGNASLPLSQLPRAWDSTLWSHFVVCFNDYNLIFSKALY
jgi:hypothetical protein